MMFIYCGFSFSMNNFLVRYIVYRIAAICLHIFGGGKIVFWENEKESEMRDVT